MAEQPRLPVARRQQSREHLHGGRLAATVGAEEAEDLASVDAEADVVHRSEVAEAHREIASLDGRFRLVGRRAGPDHDGAVSRLCVARQELDEGLLQCPGLGLHQQFVRRPRHQYPPGVHCDEPVEACSFLHVGRGNQEAHPRSGGADAFDELPELPPGQRIDPGGRLIQDEQIRVVDERAAQTQLLLHATGKLAGGAVPEGLEPGCTQKFADAPLALGPGMAEQAREEIDVLEDGQGRVQVLAEPLWHIGHPWADIATVACIGHIAAENLDRSGLDPACTGNQGEETRLADTVRPDHTDDAPGRQIERDPRQRLGLAVEQSYIAQPYHGRGIRRHRNVAFSRHCSRFCSKRSGQAALGSSRT
jgi:hypothetical protein